MRARVLRQVDELGSFPDATNHSFFHPHGIADQGDDTAIVVGVHLAVEKVDAVHLHSFENGVDFSFVAAFGKVRNAFDECRHKRRG